MKGIPCNDFYHTPKSRKNRIIYRFVTDDGNTPSGCTVQLGDKDPKTGETITDVDFFMEYYKKVDHQIYIQSKETKGLLYMDGILDDEEGKDRLEKKSDFSVPASDPFGEDEPEDIFRLQELAASLDDRMKDIFEALLVQYAGGKEKISMTELARKWGVSVTQICKDRNKLIRMIKEKIVKQE